MKRSASFPSFWFNHSQNIDTYCHVTFYIYWGSCNLNYVVHFTDVQFWTIHCCYHIMLFSDHAQVFTQNPYIIRLMMSKMWPNCIQEQNTQNNNMPKQLTVSYLSTFSSLFCFLLCTILHRKLKFYKKGQVVVNTQLVRWCNAKFIAETTCFGLCTGPSSGLDVHQKENYTVCCLHSNYHLTRSHYHHWLLLK